MNTTSKTTVVGCNSAAYCTECAFDEPHSVRYGYRLTHPTSPGVRGSAVGWGEERTPTHAKQFKGACWGSQTTFTPTYKTCRFPRNADKRSASVKHCQGFSLLELILVIVIVGIAAVPLMNGFMTMGSWLSTPIESVPAGAQLAQECAEHIVSLRRQDNYAGVATTSCNGLPALPSGYSRSVTVTDRTNATLAACPAGTNCKEVAITVTKGGVTVGRANLMLVQY